MESRRPSAPDLRMGGEALRRHATAGPSGWLLVPSTSGPELVRVLSAEGLRVVARRDDHVDLAAGDGRVMRVPLVDHVRPELVVTLLHDVGLTPAAFTERLLAARDERDG